MKTLPADQPSTAAKGKSERGATKSPSSGVPTQSSSVAIDQTNAKSVPAMASKRCIPKLRGPKCPRRSPPPTPEPPERRRRWVAGLPAGVRLDRRTEADQVAVAVDV